MSQPLETKIAVNLTKQLEALNVKITTELECEGWTKELHDMVVVQGELLHQFKECTNVSSYDMEELDSEYCSCGRCEEIRDHFINGEEESN